MKRPARKLALFLMMLIAGGAIVNIAVAWGLAVRSDANEFRDRNGLTRIGEGLHWAVEQHDSFGKTWYESKVWSGFASRYMHDCTAEELVPKWGRLRRPEPLETGRDGYLDQGFMTIIDQASGWPMLCMWCGWGIPELSNDFTASYRPLEPERWTISIKAPNAGGVGGTALPLHPIWRGFVINTVFYAVILWMLFAAPFALRRRRRIKRGLCPKCAYPVGDSVVCTECGAGVKPKAVAA